MTASRFFFILCFAVLLCSSPAAALPSADIPLESWIYPALEKLGGLGLIDSDLQGSRPFTRLEAARQLEEALAHAEYRETLPVTRTLLGRLQAEFRQDLIELRHPSEGGYLQPLSSLEVGYLYREGVFSSYPPTNARQFALNVNNEGVEYNEHHNARLSFESMARLGPLLLQARPLLLWRENAYGDGSDTSLELLQGKAALGLGPFELSAGRQSLWWGPARHGALVLSNNAEPLDMVRLTNPSPVLLPWIFRYLGPFRFDLFATRLEEDRHLSEPYFGGVRLDLKPLPWLEIGGMRTVMFGGGDIDIELDDFLTIVGGENLEPGEDTSNSIAALDLRLRIAPLWGAELYAEVGGEDEADALGTIPFISQVAFIGGLYLPRIEPTGRAALRVEFADTTDQRKGAPMWYRHGLFLSGYTYEGRILGHHAGGDARDLFAELAVLLPRDLNLSLELDYQRRGVSLPVEEKHLLPAVGLEWIVSDRLRLEGRYTVDLVDNFGFTEGEDRTFHFAALTMNYSW